MDVTVSGLTTPPRKIEKQKEKIKKYGNFALKQGATLTGYIGGAMLLGKAALKNTKEEFKDTVITKIATGEIKKILDPQKTSMKEKCLIRLNKGLGDIWDKIEMVYNTKFKEIFSDVADEFKNLNKSQKGGLVAFGILSAFTIITGLVNLAKYHNKKQLIEQKYN